MLGGYATAGTQHDSAGHPRPDCSMRWMPHRSYMVLTDDEPGAAWLEKETSQAADHAPINLHAFDVATPKKMQSPKVMMPHRTVEFAQFLGHGNPGQAADRGVSAGLGSRKYK